MLRSIWSISSLLIGMGLLLVGSGLLGMVIGLRGVYEGFSNLMNKNQIHFDVDFEVINN